jgi:hypothetical protein
MASPRDHVLTTPELLEAIFLHLPPQTLLLVQLVSPRWHITITCSPLLQQSLFLRPAPLQSSWTANPLLRSHFLPWFVMPTDHYSFSMPTYDSLQMLDWIHGKTPTRDAFLREGASWRKMLLVQPPPRQLHLLKIAQGQGGDWEEKAIVNVGERGVTMGLVYDVTESFLRGEPVSSFGLTVGLPPRDNYMRSRDKVFDGSEGIEWEYSRDTDGDDGLDMDHKTDLTPGKGGVDEDAWEQWNLERVGVVEVVTERNKRTIEAREGKGEWTAMEDRTTV